MSSVAQGAALQGRWMQATLLPSAGRGRSPSANQPLMFCGVLPQPTGRLTFLARHYPRESSATSASVYTRTTLGSPVGAREPCIASEA